MSEQIVMVKWCDLADAQVNRAMRALYDQGCRRFRTIRMIKNGDYNRFRVMGWAE